MQDIVLKQLSVWQSVFSKQRFLVLFLAGYFFTFVLTYSSPLILAFVQAREGVVLNDILLQKIPSVDFSNLIFVTLYLQIAWMFLRSLQEPEWHLELIWSFLLFYTFRFITIYFTPLEPPRGIINLEDPFARLLIYNHAVINKDLFFSGHVGFAFTIYMLLPTKIEKTVGLLVVIIVAILILFQHVHYTIDVLAAPFFGYFSYWLSKRITVFALQK